MRPKVEDEAHDASTVTSMDTSPEIAGNPLNHRGNKPLMVELRTLTQGRQEGSGPKHKTRCKHIYTAEPCNTVLAATAYLTPSAKPDRPRAKARATTAEPKRIFVKSVAPATLAELARSISGQDPLGSMNPQ